VTISIMVVLASFVMLSMGGYSASQNLENSAKDLRSLLYMTRAMAMHDGIIYRVRFDDEDRPEETAGTLAWYQPIIERQVDPIAAPEDYEPVNETWASDPVLEEGIRTYAIVFGEPSFEGTLGEDLQNLQPDEGLPQEQQRKPEDLAPIVFTPDGTAEWFTLWLTTAPEEDDPTGKEHQQLSLVMDGRTGQVWIQQPLDEAEIELLKSYNLAPLIRQDRIDQPRLTEANILRLNKKR
jgi:hypothetical protein